MTQLLSIAVRAAKIKEQEVLQAASVAVKVGGDKGSIG